MRQGSLWHRLLSLLKLIAIGVVVAVEVIVVGVGAVGGQAFTWTSADHAIVAAADGIADIGNTLEAWAGRSLRPKLHDKLRTTLQAAR